MAQMEESEFDIIGASGEEEVRSAVEQLKEVEQAYRSAHDSLVKSNILLQDTLSLTLELALKRIPPSYESSTADLTKRITESLYSSSESVLRDHVKSLCAKLVEVNRNYEKLSKEMHSSTSSQEETLPEPQLDRLAEALRQIDSILPPAGDDVETPKAGTSGDATDVAKLCELAESIKDRVQGVVDARKEAPVEPLNVIVTATPSLPAEPEKSMDMTRMIREEVASVLQAELGSILNQQKEAIQEMLQPLANSKAQQPSVPAAPVVQAEARMPKLPNQPSVSTEPERHTDAVMSIPIQSHHVPPPVYGRPPREGRPSERQHGQPLAPTQPASVEVQQPVVSGESVGNDFIRVSHSVPTMSYNAPFPHVTHGVGPTRPTRRQNPRDLRPSYTPENERPVCPNCNLECPDRISLEQHLDRCLSA